MGAAASSPEGTSFGTFRRHLRVTHLKSSPGSLSSPTLKVTQRLKFEPELMTPGKNGARVLRGERLSRAKSWVDEYRDWRLNPDLAISPSHTITSPTSEETDSISSSPATDADASPAVSTPQHDADHLMSVESSPKRMPLETEDLQLKRLMVRLDASSPSAHASRRQLGATRPARRNAAAQPSRLPLLSALLWPLLFVLLLLACQQSPTPTPLREAERLPTRRLAPFRIGRGWPRGEARARRAAQPLTP